MAILLLTLWLGAQQGPALDAAFSAGATWADYLHNANQQRQIWQRNAGREVPSALVDRFKKAGAGLRVLVIAEDWCSDSVNSIPYLGTLATKAGVELRVINSQAGRPFTEAHHTPDGRAATPTVILIRDGKDVGAWVERPGALQAWFTDMTDKIDSAERQQRKMNWYDWSRGDDALQEIVALAEQTLRVSGSITKGAGRQ